jgi:hypothetical protein
MKTASYTYTKLCLFMTGNQYAPFKSKSRTLESRRMNGTSLSHDGFTAKAGRVQHHLGYGG